MSNSMSLASLSAWCSDYFGPHEVQPDPSERRFDLPWVVMDNRRAKEHWNWEPRTSINENLEEIAIFAEKNPEWSKLTRS